MRFLDFFWLIVIAFVFASFLVVLFGVTVDILGDRQLGGWAKAIWILLLVLFPLITALVYLIVRGSGMGSRQQAEREKSGVFPTHGEGAGRSPTEEIAAAKSLLDAGTITEDEFQALKDGALGRGTPRHRAPDDDGRGAQGVGEGLPAEVTPSAPRTPA